jgi:hypothetical protein
MSYFEYKVIPAPRRVKRVKGLHDPSELFAHTLTDAINEQAREGWEYVRAESLTAETPKGWLRRSSEEDQSVLVFRRERETLGPRVAAVHEPAPERRAAPAEPPAPEPSVFGDRSRAPAPRREPTLGPATPPPAPTPLRPTPRLGPADRV